PRSASSAQQSSDVRPSALAGTSIRDGATRVKRFHRSRSSSSGPLARRFANARFAAAFPASASMAATSSDGSHAAHPESMRLPTPSGYWRARDGRTRPSDRRPPPCRAVLDGPAGRGQALEVRDGLDEREPLLVEPERLVAPDHLGG